MMHAARGQYPPFPESLDLNKNQTQNALNGQHLKACHCEQYFTGINMMKSRFLL